MRFSRNNIICFLVFLMVGFFIGRFFYQTPVGEINNNIRVSKKGVLTNPLLDCSEISSFSNSIVYRVRDSVREYVDRAQANGVEMTAVYFRDLNNGPWFGVNEKEDYYPASLLKVPLMMALYKQGEKQPGFLDKEVLITDDGRNNVEFFKADKFALKGKTYTVRQLIEFMIENSDNNSSHALTQIVDIDILKQTYEEMGVKVPDVPNYMISVRTYASFFRILYNSTYLKQEYSEAALHTLSESQIQAGIVSGLPKNVLVAHKFGERDMGLGKKQFHDCGIVYANNPYILCVMTRGRDYDMLVNSIAKISRIVYDGLKN